MPSTSLEIVGPIAFLSHLGATKSSEDLISCFQKKNYEDEEKKKMHTSNKTFIIL